jgi:hypothetical protein
VALDFPVCTFSVEESLEFNEPGGEQGCVKRRGYSQGKLKVERIGTPKNEILGQIFVLQLFEEQLDEGFGNIPDHVELWTTTHPSSEKETPAHFTLHDHHERRQGRILKKIANLPCCCMAYGSPAVRFANVL